MTTGPKSLLPSHHHDGPPLNLTWHKASHGRAATDITSTLVISSALMAFGSPFLQNIVPLLLSRSRSTHRRRRDTTTSWATASWTIVRHAKMVTVAPACVFESLSGKIASDAQLGDVNIRKRFFYER